MREVSLLMLSDNRLRCEPPLLAFSLRSRRLPYSGAMSPEERLGADATVSVVPSVTEVVISGDLQIAKVYVSFYGDERSAELAFAGLLRCEGYVRSRVGKAMQLRSVPEIRFTRDEGASRGGRVLSLLAGLRSERESDELAQSEGDGEATESEADVFSEQSDTELLYDSADEDIILT
jgi:ribosome-binding factor A